MSRSIIAKGSFEIDEIQSEIGMILSRRDESKYYLIIEMTEKIANIAWKTCMDSLSGKEEEEFKTDTLLDYIDNDSPIYTEEERKLKKKNIGHIYILKDGDYFRVGKAINVEKRVKTHLSSSATTSLFYKSPLIELHSKLETQLHQAFKDNVIRNEWFKSTDKEVMEVVERMLKGFVHV